jgi:hypothetical protein
VKRRAPLGLKRGFAQRNYIFAVSIEEVIRHHDELAARPQPASHGVF